jgi:rhomboid family GlyGly-CTERM serine protease
MWYGDTLRPALRYDVDAIAAGEIWRLWTANLMHTNAAHWGLNMAGLAVIWTVFRGQMMPRWSWGIFWLVLAPAHLLLLYWFAPSLRWYVGMSGLLHGWLAAAAILDIRARYWVGYLLLGGLAAKLGWEQLYGAPEQVSALIQAQVATQAHLAGAFVGAAVGLLWPSFCCSHCHGQHGPDCVAR